MTQNAWTIIMSTLKRQGVDAVFGLPNDDLSAFEAAQAEGMRWVLTRDQRNALFMGGGYSLGGHRLAVCVVGKGPALSNALTGLVECQGLAAPVLLIASGTRGAAIGTGAFQELDQLTLARAVTKWAHRIEAPEGLVWALQRACFLALNGQPGPVYLEIPENLDASCAFALPENTLAPLERLSMVPPAHALQQAWGKMLHAQRPLILLGGGALSTARGRLFERLAQRLGAAVFVTASGRGALLESDERFCGLAGIYTAPALRKLWTRADLFLVLGSRLEETTLALLATADRCANWIQVDVEPANFSHRIQSEKLQGDAAEVVEYWLTSNSVASAPEPTSGKEEWSAVIAALRTQAHEDAQSQRLQVPHLAKSGIAIHEVLQALMATAPDDTIFVHENGLSDMWTYFYPHFILHGAQRCVVPSEQTTLGFGAAAALGIKLSQPESTVIALVGDGAFNLFRSDFGTAVEQELGVIYVVFNNHSYGWLEHHFQSHTPQESLKKSRSPFALAIGCIVSQEGITTYQPDDVRALHQALQMAIEERTQGHPTVIDVRLAKLDAAPGLEYFYTALASIRSSL